MRIGATASAKLGAGGLISGFGSGFKRGGLGSPIHSRLAAMATVAVDDSSNDRDDILAGVKAVVEGFPNNIEDARILLNAITGYMTRYPQHESYSVSTGKNGLGLGDALSTHLWNNANARDALKLAMCAEKRNFKPRCWDMGWSGANLQFYEDLCADLDAVPEAELAPEPKPTCCVGKYASSLLLYRWTKKTCRS